MTTLDWASLSLSRLTAVAKPIPMAVPSVRIPQRKPAKNSFKIRWSVVRGHWVKASPEKTESPILSYFRLSTKSIATRLLTSRRSGLKSCANILLDKSMTKAMSIPSAVTSSSLSISCGRASATTKAIKLKIRKKGSKLLNLPRSDLIPASDCKLDILMVE